MYDKMAIVKSLKWRTYVIGKNNGIK